VGEVPSGEDEGAVGEGVKVVVPKVIEHLEARGYSRTVTGPEVAAPGVDDWLPDLMKLGAELSISPVLLWAQLWDLWQDEAEDLVDEGAGGDGGEVVMIDD
jgi:hypothetical protein